MSFQTNNLSQQHDLENHCYKGSLNLVHGQKTWNKNINKIKLQITKQKLKGTIKNFPSKIM